MGESVKTSEQSMTSSDLGSSCCDDADLSNDVKDKSDDAISVAGSACMTIDSLEEEDVQELQCDQLLSSAATEQPEMLQLSKSKDSFYLHEQKDTSAIDSCKDQCKVSDLVVHSEPGIRSKDKASKSTSTENGNGDSGVDRAKEEQKTKEQLKDDVCKAGVEKTTKLETTEEKSPTAVTLEHKDTQTIACEHPQKTESSPLKTKSTLDTKSQEPHVHSDDQNAKLILRKSRSLTDESSTDPLSPKSSRRSGIPRRKNSTQSMITSGRSTPISSPARARRSLTLDSAGDADLAVAQMKWGACSPASSVKSFPTSPVKVPSKLRRSASQCECSCLSGVPCAPLTMSRDTVTSRLRFEKHHQDHGGVRTADSPGLYLTPSQRKDFALKELRAQVKELRSTLQDKEQELDALRARVDEDSLQMRQKLEEELEEAKSSAEAARKEVCSLQDSHTQSVQSVATLEQQLDDLKKDMRNKLAESENIFLEMYNKGRQSAIFEHEEELALQRKGPRSQGETEKELYTKLVKAQGELARWQTIQRHQSFNTMPIPGTEAETTLRFLKDSVFHYLTKEKAASDEHLRAIVRILHFSDDQRERIAQAIIMKRNKSGW